MELREITTKEEMLKNFELLKEMYPSLTMEEYASELDVMLPHNYTQVGVFEHDFSDSSTSMVVADDHIIQFHVFSAPEL